MSAKQEEGFGDVEKSTPSFRLTKFHTKVFFLLNISFVELAFFLNHFK